MAEDRDILSQGYVDLTEEKNGGVLKKVIEEGKEASYPPDGSSVCVHYTGMFENKEVFDSSLEGPPLKVKIGLNMVIRGWELCIPTMCIGEKAQLICKPEYAYGEEGSPPDIPANSTLIFTLELLSFEKPMMSVIDFVEKATEVKIEGNELFKSANYKEACNKYEEALDFFRHLFPKEDSEKELMNETKLPCLLNLAACYLKLGEFSQARLCCEKSLDIDEKNVKAIFRRGQSWAGTYEWEKARRDIMRAIELSPNSPELRRAYQDIKKQKRAYQQEQKKLYGQMGKMFK